MAMVRWDPVMRTGVDFADEDHQRLLDAVGNLEELIRQGRLVDDGLTAFRGLVAVTRRHFAEEEAFMRRNGHPGYVQHKLEHDDFLDHLERFERQFGKGGVAMHEDMLRFVSLWFLGHILGSDRNLAHQAHRHSAAA